MNFGKGKAKKSKAKKGKGDFKMDEKNGDESKMVQVKCAHCGNVFECTWQDYRRGRKYCSAECRDSAEKKHEEKHIIELDEYGSTVVEGVDEKDVPSIFNTEQFNYATELANHMVLNDLKGEILNVIEGIGLRESQERAIKRTVTNMLHQFTRDYKEFLEIVLDKN
jgi:endogenous inhibitor of DNA gyrase (YacG/DUF329 family)